MSLLQKATEQRLSVEESTQAGIEALKIAYSHHNRKIDSKLIFIPPYKYSVSDFHYKGYPFEVKVRYKHYDDFIIEKHKIEGLLQLNSESRIIVIDVERREILISKAADYIPFENIYATKTTYWGGDYKPKQCMITDKYKKYKW